MEQGKRHPTLKNGVVIGAGAKVLGPLTVGTEARIGSNAVVVVMPEGATMVGIPARVAKSGQDKETNERRAKMAKAYGFDAYAIAADNPIQWQQPLVECSIMYVLDQRSGLCQAVNRLGSDVCGDLKSDG